MIFMIWGAGMVQWWGPDVSLVRITVTQRFDEPVGNASSSSSCSKAVRGIGGAVNVTEVI